MLAFALSDEQTQLKETARRFAVEEMIPVASRYDEEQRFPEDVARKAWELGLMNLELPRDLGGPGPAVLPTGLVRGQFSFGVFCITAPGAGSDVAGLSTTDGRVGDSCVMNGPKHFISNG